MVAPVGCEDKEENRVEFVVVGEVEPSDELNREGLVLVFGMGFVELLAELGAKEDAIFDMNDPEAAPVGFVATPLVGGEVCAGGLLVFPIPMASSIRVGIFGTGGGGETGTPNGFLDPV